MMRTMQLPVMAAFVCICVTASLSRAQPTLSGTVTDKQGGALENAVVDLKGAGLRVLTDAEGRFDFSKATNCTVRGDPRGYVHLVMLKGNRIGFQVKESGTRISVALFSPVGRRSYVLATGVREKGAHWIRLPDMLPSGTWIVRIDKGGSMASVPVAVASGIILPGRPPREALGVPRGKRQALLARSAASDTLVVSRFGFYTTTQSVPDLTADHLLVQLDSMPSDSIVPPGMKPIPGGTFMMGSEDGNPDETPVHSVTVSAFFMDSTEVTQMDYASLMGVEPWLGYEGFYPGGVGARRPVWYIDWYDAVLYCNERSKRDGLDTVYTYSSIIGTAGDGSSAGHIEIHYDKTGYRLPTEAEWEYAARAGTDTEYYWGVETEFAVVSNYAWYSRNSEGGTQKVAGTVPNHFGLYDVAGNVYEFCNDFDDPDYYSVSKAVDPTGPNTGTSRSLRGGDWRAGVSQLRSADRFAASPRDRYGSANTFGIRTVLPMK